MKTTIRNIIFASALIAFCFCNAQKASDYKRKAEQGDASSQMVLGICFKDGKGTTQDYQQAVYWFEKAAKQGLSEAQVLLGDCYRYGTGVEKDSLKAYQLYETAVMCGASMALDAMGDSYYYGIGVERDVIRARHYYMRAMQRGFKKSKAKYEKIRNASQDGEILDFNS